MVSSKLLFMTESNMENKKSSSTNDKKQPQKRNGSYRNKSDLNNPDVKDGINYDYDWNTEYGDGDIPDVDEP